MLATFLLALAHISFADRVELSGDRLMLGDVADLQVLPPELREKAGALQLANLTDDKHPVAFDHAFLASRARSLLPALKPWLPESFGGQLLVNRGARKPAFAAKCGEDGLKKGDTVTLSLRVGGVTVERRSKALQSVEAGEQFFARSEDGSVLTAICEESI